MNIEVLRNQFNSSLDWMGMQIHHPTFKLQMVTIAFAIMMSLVITFILKRIFKENERQTTKRYRLLFKDWYAHLYRYLFPTLFIISLSVAEDINHLSASDAWLISLLQTLIMIYMIHQLLNAQIKSLPKRRLAQILLLPIIFFYFMGWLDEISLFLSGFTFTIGNITVSLNGFIKTALFGILLLWIGKASNLKGQSLIRSQKSLDSRSKELFSKIFEIGLYVLIFMLLLEVAGIDIKTLALFGGALGLGLGFGLQSIASNFISGIIILLDRSLSVGDYIELESGQKGIVRELNMRSATIETFEGKDVLVPNEKFISSTFTNWTHQNLKQRYSLELQVAYDTDLHFLFDLIRTTLISHPQVLSGEHSPKEEQPDAEISSFGDSGVNILIEFWMEGIDDGRNRVGADILLLLWDAFKTHKITIPFPQREVKVFNS